MSDFEFTPAPEVQLTHELIDALLQRNDCTVLEDLNRIRKLGWTSSLVHDYFKHQRFEADYVKHKDNDEMWLWPMYHSLRNMDYGNRQFVRTQRFLDIGCCPGGYSTYILSTCPYATGMGISLPEADGGYGLAMPANLRCRFDLQLADISLLDLAQGSIPLRLPQIPFPLNSFDFVVADAHHLRLNPDNELRSWNWSRLLVSQILLALYAIQDDGKIFLKLSHAERSLTARILLAFCRVSKFTHAIKSKTIHRSRSSFYILAKGINVGSPAYRQLVAGLELLWYKMTFGGEAGYGREIELSEWDLITPWEDVMRPDGVAQIARLGKHMWRIQLEGLARFLSSKGVAV